MMVTQCSCLRGILLNTRKTRIIEAMHAVIIHLSWVAYDKCFVYRRHHIFSMGPLPHSTHRMYRYSMSSDPMQVLFLLFHWWLQALFTAHYSDPDMKTELLTSSWVFLWLNLHHRKYLQSYFYKTCARRECIFIWVVSHHIEK